jgi:hypothetical protein
MDRDGNDEARHVIASAKVKVKVPSTVKKIVDVGD